MRLVSERVRLCARSKGIGALSLACCLWWCWQEAQEFGGSEQDLSLPRNTQTCGTKAGSLMSGWLVRSLGALGKLAVPVCPCCPACAGAGPGPLPSCTSA